MPGQAANPRYVELDKLFLGKQLVDGVIHVVANGLATVRMADAAAILVEQGITTIAKFKTHQKKRELDDLKETCELIRQSHRNHRAPKWLLLAVDKIDLYHNEVNEIQGYYSNDSAFTQRLNELANQVGTDFFNWMALPIAGCCEDFSWNDQSLSSRFNDELRNRYLAGFLQELTSR